MPNLVLFDCGKSNLEVSKLIAEAYPREFVTPTMIDQLAAGLERSPDAYDDGDGRVGDGGGPAGTLRGNEGSGNCRTLAAVASGHRGDDCPSASMTIKSSAAASIPISAIAIVIYPLQSFA